MRFVPSTEGPQVASRRPTTLHEYDTETRAEKDRVDAGHPFISHEPLADNAFAHAIFNRLVGAAWTPEQAANEAANEIGKLLAHAVEGKVIPTTLAVLLAPWTE